MNDEPNVELTQALIRGICIMILCRLREGQVENEIALMRVERYKKEYFNGSN